MFTHSLIKKLCCLILLSATFVVKAQQVKKIDCCKDLSSKATIIINDNTSTANGSTSSSSSATSNNTYGTFNFEITSSANTSAGVYDASNNLVRTLWGGVRYDIGCYQGQWDGLLEDGSQAPNGTYQVKILTNNVQYTWEGGIGDSSTDPVSDHKLRGNDYTAIVALNGIGYGSVGYSEGETALKTFNLSDINYVNPPSGSTEMNISAVATDGNLIYLGGDKAGSGSDGINYHRAWVQAIHPGDINLSQNPVSFVAQQSFTANSGSGGLTVNNAIAVSLDPTDGSSYSYVNNLAVQKSGNFLFVDYAGLNRVDVLDKRTTSGALIKSNTISSPQDIACDDNGNLYIAASGVKEYTVNSDGSFTDSGISFTGISSASKVAYSSALNKIAVFDNTTFQIKIYNPSGGAPLQTVGIAGGYGTSPFFDATHLADANFMYYQQDGTLWLGQPALHSILHFNLDFTIKEESQHLPTSRCVTADQNNPTRVFANYNEYTRDYSKTLDNGKNGSWKIAANWNKGTNTSNDNYNGLTWVCTLSNGHTYATEYRAGIGSRLVELVSSSGMRIINSYFNGNIGRDGTWYEHGDNNSYSSQPVGIYKHTLTGFDSSYNPVWSSGVLLVADPPSSIYTPWYTGETTSGQTAGIDKYVYFNAVNGQNDPTGGLTIGYHLGAVSTATGKPVWQTARSTLYSYLGPYPVNGDYDIGNNIGYSAQHSETHAMVYDNDVFQNVNGEFWQNTEANHWNHFDAKTGLVISHFGTDGNLANLIPGKPGMAGNAFSTQVVKVGSEYYIYHCDESVHAFIHSWHVTGLNSINVTTIPITVTAAINLPADPADLMAGIPYKSSGFYGGNGWTMNPAAYDNHSYGDAYPNWRVATSVRTYSKGEVDLAWISDDNANGTITRELGTNNTNNWSLSGAVMQDYYSDNDRISFDVVDASGKTIVTFHSSYDGIEYVNDQAYVSANRYKEAYYFFNFKINCIGGALSFSYADQPITTISKYDNSASSLTPKQFRIKTSGSGNGNHTIGSLKRLRFNAN